MISLTPRDVAYAVDWLGREELSVIAESLEVSELVLRRALQDEGYLLGAAVRSCRHWTEEERLLLRECWTTRPIGYICNRLARDRSEVERQAKVCGLGLRDALPTPLSRFRKKNRKESRYDLGLDDTLAANGGRRKRR